MWRKVETIQCLDEGSTVRLRVEGKKLVIEKEEPDWVDITESCSIDMIETSQPHGGFYLRVDDDEGESKVAVISLDASKIRVEHGYKITKVDGASYACRIFRQAK